MKNMKVVLGALVVFAFGAFAACGNGTNNNISDAGNGFPQPAGTVPVNFTVNDSTAHLYAEGDLQWKGSFYWNPTTRVLTKDSTWSGGDGTTTTFPGLYDDGPWTEGGHEPIGSTAADHKLGVTVFATPPATGSDTYEYGLNDAKACSTAAVSGGQVTSCNGWAWVGSNGTFDVTPTSTTINAAGLTTVAPGTNDLRLTLDTTALPTRTLADGGTDTWNTTSVHVKGSAWNWSEANLANASGQYVFTLSDWVGTGHAFPHGGLAASGSTPEFVWVLNGVEYKDANGDAIATGVTAETKATGGSFTPRTITVNGGHNTTVTVP